MCVCVSIVVSVSVIISNKALLWFAKVLVSAGLLHPLWLKKLYNGHADCIHDPTTMVTALFGILVAGVVGISRMLQETPCTVLFCTFPWRGFGGEGSFWMVM